MKDNDESQQRIQRQRNRRKRIFENILSNGVGYTLIWVGMVLAGMTYVYLPSQFSNLGFIGVVILFLTYNYWSPESYLHRAVKKSDIEAVKKYLEKGGNINIKSIFGHTALLIASKCASQEMLSFLIEQGANVNATLDCLESPLHWAVASRDPFRVELLIKNGARVNWQDDLGYTPLHWAVSRDFLEVAQVLINHGADINIRTDDNKTVIEVALEKKNEKMLEILRNAP